LKTAPQSLQFALPQPALIFKLRLIISGQVATEGLH
jgi:hypothetical protein